MTVIFFKRNFVFVKNFIRNNNDCVAFWYGEGLASFQMLHEVIKIDKILIEDVIYKPFINQYSSITNGVTIESFDTVEGNEQNDKKIYFFASNDTHVHLFKNIINRIPSINSSFFCKMSENASSEAQKNGINLIGNQYDCAKKMQKSSILVLGNDWGIIERNLSNQFINRGINTVCLQESIIDFNLSDNRMRNCSFPIFQGLNSLKTINLDKLICGVIGNPRFEELRIVEPVKIHKVFINVNFTYGIYEEARESWLKDILKCCDNLNLDYIISQHPRDRGNLEGLNVLKSNAGIVHKTIVESSVVISRFSAIILESIALGRPSIYYNPHGENMAYELKSDNKVLFYATDTKSLLSALNEILSDKYVFPDDNMLPLHLGDTNYKKASFYISDLLNDLKCHLPLHKKSLFEFLLIKLKIIKFELKNRLTNN